MLQRHTEDQGATSARVPGQPLPFSSYHSRSDLISRNELVDRLDLTWTVPWNVRKVRLIVAPKILEWRQKLQVKRLPQPKFKRGRAVGPHIEVRRERLPVGAFWSCRQTQQNVRRNGSSERVELRRGDSVALINDNRVPEVVSMARQEFLRSDALDGREEMIMLVSVVPAGEK